MSGGGGSSSWRFEKQYELWQQQQTSVSRWAIGTIAFALVIPLLVLGPFDRLATKIDEVKLQLASIEAQQKQANELHGQLEQLQTATMAVAQGLAAEPWEADKEQLKVTMRALGNGTRALQDADPQTLQEADMYRASLREQDRVRPPTMNNSNMANQAAPRGEGSNPPYGRSETVLVPPDSPELADGEAGRIPAVAEAIDLLEVDPQSLANASPQERQQTLSTCLERRAGEEADRMIERVRQRTQDEVIQPLKTAIAEAPQAAEAVPGLAGELREMEQELDTWVTRFKGNREWYRTLQGKDETVASLGGSIGHFNETVGGASASWKDKCQSLVAQQQAAVTGAEQSLEARAAAMKEQLAQQQADADTLGKKLEGVLPSWIGNLVSPAEMVQVFPAIMLILVAAIAFQTWKLHCVFRALELTARQEDIPISEVADASTWTLRPRFAAPTFVTLAVYIGGILLLWWLFEQGSTIACRFKPPEKEIALQLLQTEQQSTVQLVGRGMFFAALLLIGYAVFFRAGRSEAAASTRPINDSQRG